MKFFYEKDGTRPVYDANRDGNVFDWIMVASEDLREKEIEKKSKMAKGKMPMKEVKNGN